MRLVHALSFASTTTIQMHIVTNCVFRMRNLLFFHSSSSTGIIVCVTPYSNASQTGCSPGEYYVITLPPVRPNLSRRLVVSATCLSELRRATKKACNKRPNTTRSHRTTTPLTTVYHSNGHRTVTNHTCSTAANFLLALCMTREGAEFRVLSSPTSQVTEYEYIIGR